MAQVVQRVRLAGHRAVVRPPADHRAVGLRVEAHQAPAAQLEVAAPVVVPRVAVCLAEVRAVAQVAWKAAALMGRATAPWQGAIRALVIPSAVIFHFPVLSMNSPSTVPRLVAVVAAAVRATAPVMEVGPHRIVAPAARAMEALPLVPPREKLRLLRAQMQAKAVAHEHRVV